jgi:hypothetical protein
VNATDDVGVASVVVRWSTANGAARSLTLTKGAGTSWTGSVSPIEIGGQNYRATATDGAGRTDTLSFQGPC